MREVATMNQYTIGRTQAATGRARELITTRRGRVGGAVVRTENEAMPQGGNSRTAWSQREVERFAPLGRQDPSRRTKRTGIGR
jgi:hypothetical protein